jgi:hypothetical protein
MKVSASRYGTLHAMHTNIQLGWHECINSPR